MKPYAELACDNLEQIADEIYSFLADHTDLLTSGAKNWQFLDTKQLLINSPNLSAFFAEHKLYVRNASVTLLYEDLPLHLDVLPMIAKINIPVRNTLGWTNRWFAITDDEIKQLPKIINSFGEEQEDARVLDIDQLELLGELHDLDRPIVFHSRVPHDVINQTAAVFPRIVASFTFLNQPVELLN